MHVVWNCHRTLERPSSSHWHVSQGAQEAPSIYQPDRCDLLRVPSSQPGARLCQTSISKERPMLKLPRLQAKAGRLYNSCECQFTSVRWVLADRAPMQLEGSVKLMSPLLSVSRLATTSSSSESLSLCTPNLPGKKRKITSWQIMEASCATIPQHLSAEGVSFGRKRGC